MERADSACADLCRPPQGGAEHAGIGGASSIAELDRDYRLPLQKFFQRRGCAAALAEDLTQDVFLRVVAYERSSEIRNAQSFIFQTAANRLRDVARSARRWNLSSLDESDDSGPRDAQLVEVITPERILQGRQDMQVVGQAVAELDARTRHIFLMNRIERLRQRDIAADLDLSVSLVEKTLRAAQVVVEIKYRRQRIRKDAAGADLLAMAFAEPEALRERRSGRGTKPASPEN